MRQQYYYTINSLPHLSFDRHLPIKREEFLARIQSEMDPKDLETFGSVCLYQREPERESISVLEQWYSWERGLRNRLALLRATKLGIDPKAYVRAGGDDESAARLADEIFQLESPAGAEQALNKARWDFLDKLETSHHFDLDKLIIYFLKLQLLERKSLFNEARGRERLEAVIAQVDSVWKLEGRVRFCE